MRFRAENLGPLREAEVDLSKDLIVLTGPNNSGKTYLAWTVYGLLRLQPKDRPEFLDELSEKLLASADHTLALDDLTPHLPGYVLDLVRAFGPRMHECFAAEGEQFQSAVLSVELDAPHEIDDAKARLTKRLSIFKHGIIMSTMDRLLLIVGDTNNSGQLAFSLRIGREYVPGSPKSPPLEPAMSEERALIKERLERGILRIMRWALPNCILFPAERIAVNIFAKELALNRTELVDDLLDAGASGEGAEPIEIVERRAGRYPWPIRDSLRIANDLAAVSKRRSRFEDLADEIEAAVLGGKVGVSGLGEMVYSPAEATDRRLSVHLTASMVKSLASLVFYFRHMADQGDFLIIDEPELNLHPDNQRKIARVLAKAVNRGFKIMMSTHSDYLIRELNHLIMLSRDTEAAARLATELGYDRSSLLRPEQVGVYLFNDHHAEAVPVTESGFEVKTIDDEINRLNTVSQRIYAELID